MLFKTRSLRSIRLTKGRVVLLSLLTYIVVMAYWIAPKFYTDFHHSPRITQAQLQEFVRWDSVSGAESKIDVAEVVYSPMVIVSVTRKVDAKGRVIAEQLDPKLRIDNFILYTGSWIVITLAAITLANALPRAVKIAGIELQMEARATQRGASAAETAGILTEEFLAEKASPSSKKLIDASAEKFLTADVSAALDRATELYSRSTLMLVAGVIMAFIGVGIFYVSLPQFQLGDDRWTYLEKGIRPTGMLVFVEGIAWFLLRQYRVLIEDYKAFHRMYLKRANYLVALKTVSLPEVSPSQLFLVASMISEDLTGRLKAGETTENIEGVRTIEPNPVFTLFQALVEGLRKK